MRPRNQVRDRLAYPFEDLGEHCVKYIARPVRVFRLGAGAISLLPAAHRVGGRPSPRGRAILLAGVAASGSGLVVAATRDPLGGWDANLQVGRRRICHSRPAHLARSLDVQLARAESLREHRTREGFAAALALFEKALRLDPRSVSALVDLGERSPTGLPAMDDDREADLARADEAVGRA